MSADRYVLQIPMSRSLRVSSEKKAKKLGFSSLQEAVRVILNKFAIGGLTLGFETEEVEYLTSEEAKDLDSRHKEALDGIRKGDYKVARSGKELLKQLNG